jgi:hypothetical protein
MAGGANAAVALTRSCTLEWSRVLPFEVWNCSTWNCVHPYQLCKSARSLLPNHADLRSLPIRRKQIWSLRTLDRKSIVSVLPTVASFSWLRSAP